MTNRIWTVGHSTRDFDELLEMLRGNGITCLADVRSFPSSRKYPQWNQPAIVESLPPGIGYRWIPRLGGRRHTPKGVPSANGAWRVKAFRDYADYMATDAFAEGLEELLGLAEHGRPAIMCSEAVPWRCHRRLITDALIVPGAEVVHIMSATTAKPAVLNPNARVRNGRLTYPPDPADPHAPPDPPGPSVRAR
ncbi:DUF488 family protein [Streptomyces sp. NRRL S-340]|uniref:DUF488 domain-containing protein n=1 Tax=Streptomyces sp. NRRL S-340 TaxID=1463901 RepID=UPI00055BB05B|nr:DUF488 domain-containing protein [Streptomyces sp. NRRL S-340]